MTMVHNSHGTSSTDFVNPWAYISVVLFIIPSRMDRLRGEEDIAVKLDVLPNQQSTSELFIGRRLRIPLYAMLPAKKTNGHDQKMADHFNPKHGTCKRYFHPGDPVSLDSRNCKARKGNILYEVEC
ncbi:unnamed protein product [Dicrocoelium dendriticum]|nr:unnamed protein product [Dicrocoelium dendriticum]